MSDSAVWTNHLRELPSEMLDAFARKGKGPTGMYGGNPSAATAIRRILQIVSDLAVVEGRVSTVLDLACGDGVHALETALHGLSVHGIDARTERMSQAAGFGRELGLTGLKFEQNDVRNVSVESHGRYDVVYFLGILYHMDFPDSYHVLRNLRNIARRFLVVDTHIALEPNQTVTVDGHSYQGSAESEHREKDSAAVRREHLLMSVDNTRSFWFSRESLIQLLMDVGFTSVYECYAPREPFKRRDRITVVACAGEPVVLSTYPEVNGKTEAEIQAVVEEDRREAAREAWNSAKGVKHSAGVLLNVLLRPLGYQLRRI